MAIREAKKRCLFKCDVTGLTAMFVGLKTDVQATNPDNDVCKVVYIPLMDLNEGMRKRWRGATKYKRLWKVTNKKYLTDGIIGPKPVPERNAEDGLFDMHVVATQDQSGRAPFRENFVEQTLEQRLNQLQADKEAAETELGHRDVEKLSVEHDAEINDNDNTGQNPNPQSADDALEGL